MINIEDSKNKQLYKRLKRLSNRSRTLDSCLNSNPLLELSTKIFLEKVIEHLVDNESNQDLLLLKSGITLPKIVKRVSNEKI